MHWSCLIKQKKLYLILKVSKTPLSPPLTLTHTNKCAHKHSHTHTCANTHFLTLDMEQVYSCVSQTTFPLLVDLHLIKAIKIKCRWGMIRITFPPQKKKKSLQQGESHHSSHGRTCNNNQDMMSQFHAHTETSLACLIWILTFKRMNFTEIIRC